MRVRVQTRDFDQIGEHTMPMGIYPHKVKQASDRFWSKVDKSSPVGCWMWTASVIQANGYGQFNAGPHKGMMLAHRFAYELMVGPIPDGLQLDHLCRNKLCVNPDHLEPVSQRVNILRSESFPAVNARKTHCTHGHEFTEENTRIRKQGWRSCKACNAEIERRRVRKIAS